jgi:hypothetical protein
MQLLGTRTYIAELAAAGKRHGALLSLFETFSEHAKHVAAKEYPLTGIAIAPDGSTGFTARFLDVGARFTFVHDSESGLGVIHVSDVSMGDSEPSPFWSIHFNETGEVQDIESRRNEGPITLVSTQTPQKLSSRQYISSYQSQAGPKH